jgi:CRISPR-associated endonuclease Cas1/CRISPR-associated protein Cas4
MIDPEPLQPELGLAFPQVAGAELPLLPARMLNEFVYCPRLAYLEWVQGEWADNADTTEGRFAHRVADRPGGALPPAEDTEPDSTIHARSVTLSSEPLGIIAKLDLVEGESGTVRPVDYKHGHRPHVEQSAYLPERVQVGAQVLLLQAHGYTCDEGILYFVEGRERVPVVLDDELRAAVASAANGLRLMAASGHVPPPLEDSPKCVRCSLVGICLPDEVAWLRAGRIEPRPLAVARAEALPFVVQENGARIGKDGDTLEVSVEGTKVATGRLAEVSQVAIYGNAYLTTPALHELMRREIPVSWYSYGGWFVGHTVGLGHHNAELRAHQWRGSFDAAFCLRVARGVVSAKIRNGRTLLRRNWRAAGPPDEVLAALDGDRANAEAARDLPTLLGVEGLAARRYFAAFAQCFAEDAAGVRRFDWEGRNRRPPTDPINALLSFTYAMLVRVWTVQLSAVGLDAYRGFYHQPRYGRPALALDMMEPFRPLVADSAVLLAINNGEVKGGDFIARGGAVALTSAGRHAIIATFERRLDQEITHPVFGYRVSYRRLFEVQARLFGRFLAGEIPEFPHITPR